MSSSNIIEIKSFAFAVRIVNLCKFLKQNYQEYVLNKQILRSGTAVGALVKESQNAESKADFIHKLGIAQKECSETIYWLELLKATDYLNNYEFDTLRNDANELLKIIRSIIITTKQNIHNS